VPGDTVYGRMECAQRKHRPRLNNEINRSALHDIPSSHPQLNQPDQ